jgi:UDP:flavonoid glycosyltransferase YjiC (YdhE family)
MAFKAAEKICTRAALLVHLVHPRSLASHLTSMPPFDSSANERVTDPEWWTELPIARPVVYVGLGTTGQPALLPTILDVLADLPVTLIVSTAARANLANPPRNALVAPYLSGTRAPSRSALVVCNGGTMSTRQALSVGTPVLGLVSNADQMVFMRCVVDAGAGERLRESEADASRIRDVVLQMLCSIDGYRAQAMRLQPAFARYDSAGLVAEIVERAVRGGRRADC